jgi:ABC-2 type transport system permease protein
MKTMKWLLRREFWEHKGALLWAPLVVATLMIVLVSTGLLWGARAAELNIVTRDGHTSSHVTSLASGYATMSATERQEMVTLIANNFMAPSAPLYIMMAFIAFFYCLGALFDERRDRSILFWKSLPVSDAQTVLSKVVTAILVTPLIVIAFSVFMSVLLGLIGGIGLALKGVNLFGPVLASGDLYLTPLRTLGLLPVYMIWALPTVGWLMLVSAWARSKVFLWAVGTPVIAILAVKWIDYLLGLRIDMDWFVQNIIARGLIGLFPGNWLALTRIEPDLLKEGHTLMMGKVFEQSWMTVATPHALIGAAVGIAMIFGAIRLRRWKDEG